MTSSIIDFLEARLEEDRDAALSGEFGDLRFGGVDLQANIRNQDRALREAHAKEAILEEHSTPHTVVDGFCTECGSDLPDGVHKRDRSYCEIHGWRECETVLALAAIYSDHPDYRKKWVA